MAEVVFILGDKLPLIYDAAISIYSVSKKSDCPKWAATILAYADSLKCMWEKASGLLCMFSKIIRPSRTHLSSCLVRMNKNIKLVT